MAVGSSLATLHIWSPNHYNGRKYPITKLTIHHVAGKLKAATIGKIFLPTSRKASSTYGIGYDAEIAQYVDEADAPWTSSNYDNDNRAITIEVSNSAVGGNWPVSDNVLEALIKLCVDCVQRNPGIKEIDFTGDKTGNLTMHKWFAATACPGPYLESKFQYIADEINRRLGVSAEEEDVYIKGFAKQLSTNFDSNEFDCHGNGCCTKTLIDQKLVNLLQKIRDHFGKPITITSGYRCPTHNSKVSRAKNSYHTKGQAADFTVDGVTPREVAKYAESMGIKGIGLYETDSDGHFVHIDTRTTKAFWYGQAESPVTTFGGSTAETPKEPEKEETTSDVLYRVQVGAYSFLANARQLQKKIKAAGFETYLVKADDGLYKVQVGAFAKYENAEKQVAKIKAAGFNCFITTKSGKPVDEEATDTDTKVEASTEIKEGDKVKLTKDATVYGTTGTFKPWVYDSILYVREITGNRVVVSTVKTGPVTGAVHKKHLTKV